MENLRPTFQTPYQQYSHYRGLPFELVEKIPQPKDDELETGPRYKIVINGEKIEALPEEIFTNTDWNPSVLTNL